MDDIVADIEQGYAADNLSKYGTDLDWTALRAFALAGILGAKSTKGDNND
jgi:hypothetical protein